MDSTAPIAVPEFSDILLFTQPSHIGDIFMANKNQAGRSSSKSSKTAKTGKPEKTDKKAFPLIGRNDLKSLLAQASIFQNRASMANGSLGELIRGYVKKKHLHAKAFRTVNAWVRLGQRDPSALWLELAHIDDMREKAGVDRLAKEQGQLLPALSGDEETGGEDASGTSEVEESRGDNVLTYPRDVDEKAGDAA